MNKSIVLISATLLLLILSSCHSQRESIKSSKLLWSDEFNKVGLPDSTIWGYDVGGHGWGNNELQYYTSNRLKNARVENGNLIIEAHKEAMEDKQYTSARLVTRKKKPILYGRIEVRAKLPKGVGSWPAIWMLGENIRNVGWPLCGEIDIMEHVGFDQDRVHGSIHTKSYHHSIGTQKTASRMVKDVSEAFHVYTLDWKPNRIDFYIDNEKLFTFDKEENADEQKWPFYQNQYLLLNVAVGGFWGGQKGVDDTIFPQKMLVDYVRVYDNHE